MELLVEINTSKGTFHVIAEDKLDAKNKLNMFIKEKYKSESVIIESIKILSNIIKSK